MSKEISPQIKDLLETILPDERILHLRAAILMNRRIDPLVSTLALSIKVLARPIYETRGTTKDQDEFLPVDTFVAQAILLAVEVKDFVFLNQLVRALEKLDDLDSLFDKVSENQSQILDACEKIIASGQQLTKSNIWDRLMEEPFNLYSKWDGIDNDEERGKKEASIRSRVHKDIDRLKILKLLETQ